MRVKNDMEAIAALERAYELVDATETHIINNHETEQFTRRLFQRALDQLSELIDIAGGAE